MVQSHTVTGVLSFSMGDFWSPSFKVFTGKWEQSLKLVSKAAEDSPNICGVSWDESKLCGSVGWCPKSRVVLFSFTASLENVRKLNINLHFKRQNSSLCGSGESEAIIKHLMPVARRSAALFMLFWVSDVTKKKRKHWQELIYFLYKCDKIMVENKTSLEGLVLFSQFIYLKFFFVLFVFSILFLWFLTVSTVVYIRSFVKRKKTCSVVSTLNMSLANKRFNV